MYADTDALELVREARRIGSSTLPLFNEAAVRNVIKTLRSLLIELDILLRSGASVASPSHKAAFLISHASIERCRRCLLAYLSHRFLKLRTIVWDLGAVPAELVPRFSPAEAHVAEIYSDLVLSYKGLFPGVDFSLGLTPPGDLFIYVRVLRPCGEIATESGHALRLEPGTTHYVRRSDVERLISHGYLEHVV